MKNYVRVATTPERLEEAMRIADKKQIDLANETGLSHSTISRYLSGKVEPRQDAIIKLAEALNVSEWWLWGYNVPMRGTPAEIRNSILAKLTVRAMKDDDFFEMLSLFADLPVEQYNSIKTIIKSLSQKKNS